jgi:hypothetical protein
MQPARHLAAAGCILNACLENNCFTNNKRHRFCTNWASLETYTLLVLGVTIGYFWTGGQELGDTGSTDGVWTWVDLNLEFGFTDWASGRPNPFARGFCVYLAPGSRYWLDGDCGAGWKFVCEAY